MSLVILFNQFPLDQASASPVQGVSVAASAAVAIATSTIVAQGQTIASDAQVAAAGTASVTQANALAATAVLPIAAAANITQNQVLSSAATFAIAGTSSVVQSQTLAAAGTLAIVAASSVVQGQALASATTILITADAAVSQPQTLVSDGTVADAGSYPEIQATFGATQSQSVSAVLVNISELQNEVFGAGGYYSQDVPAKPKVVQEVKKAKKIKAKRTTERLVDVEVTVPGNGFIGPAGFGITAKDVVASGLVRIVGAQVIPAAQFALTPLDLVAVGKDWRDVEDISYAAIAALM